MARRLMEVTQKLPCLRKGGDLPRDEMGILEEISGLDGNSISTRFNSFTRLATRGEVDRLAFQTLLTDYVPHPLKGISVMAPALFGLVDLDKNGGISFREALAGLTMGDGDVQPVNRLKSLLSLLKWTQGNDIEANKASDLLQQAVGISEDKQAGFTPEAVSNIVNMAKSGSTVNISDLSQKLDILSHVI